MGSKRSHRDGKKKELCLVLGGTPERELVCLRIAAEKYPKTPIWLTGPALTEDCLRRCTEAGVNLDYLLVDYRALDTLSNFTSLVDEMKTHRFTHVVLVTSEAHMERAKAVGKIVLENYDIKIRMEMIDSQDDERPDSPMRIQVDELRAIFWVYFGFDITFPAIWLLHPDRIKQRDRRVKNHTWHGRKCYD